MKVKATPVPYSSIVGAGVSISDPDTTEVLFLVTPLSLSGRMVQEDFATSRDPDLVRKAMIELSKKLAERLDGMELEVQPPLNYRREEKKTTEQKIDSDDPRNDQLYMKG
jgi:hypothetical protein